MREARHQRKKRMNSLCYSEGSNIEVARTEMSIYTMRVEMIDNLIFEETPVLSHALPAAMKERGKTYRSRCLKIMLSGRGKLNKMSHLQLAQARCWRGATSRRNGSLFSDKSGCCAAFSGVMVGFFLFKGTFFFLPFLSFGTALLTFVDDVGSDKENKNEIYVTRYDIFACRIGSIVLNILLFCNARPIL